MFWVILFGKISTSQKMRYQWEVELMSYVPGFPGVPAAKYGNFCWRNDPESHTRKNFSSGERERRISPWAAI